MSDDLVAFLNARLDEDETVARAAADAVARDVYFNPFSGPRELGEPALMRPINDARVHMARHDPDRVLREVAAKRAILAEYQGATAITGEDDQYAAGLGMAISILAVVYSDQPD